MTMMIVTVLCMNMSTVIRCDPESRLFPIFASERVVDVSAVQQARRLA